MIAIIKVKFLNDDNILSKREYEYAVKSVDLPALNIGLCPTVYYEKVEIETFQIKRVDNGHDYYDHRVVILDARLETNDSILTIFKNSKTVRLSDPKTKRLSVYGCDYNRLSLQNFDKQLSEYFKKEKCSYITNYDGSLTYINDSEDIYAQETKKSNMGFYSSSDMNVSAYTSYKDNMVDIATSVYEKMNNNEKKESSNMLTNVMKDIEFGIAKDVKFSLYGPAFKTAEGRYVALTADGQSYDVTGLTLDDLDKMNYMFPTAATEIAAGDFIRHNKEWVKVSKVNEDHSLVVLKMSSNEEVTIHPVKNVFGFNYYTKLMTICGQLTGTPDEKNPFGNLLPLMLLSDSDSSMSKVLPFMMMSQGGEFKMDMNNPLLLMAMMK